ncbi:hypothetical protein BO79DRAFT_278793 [Aspergillus costaricaensis CBS 115574]|uniref:Uncharacterized protein n=1 Tax=Aspergillus costaricaensis CBS 115574 TaxID=1448317 RepID=A0ACD1INB7_9EURO|nr:hypothetical protein BO79DRAFT_278793 [Aspergillus costaricaensis CBS 115574]RAK92055.1 hypothetical protein BO79DRAFT_278793 [Aspergillus costaricaensis CBS 115574]
MVFGTNSTSIPSTRTVTTATPRPSSPMDDEDVVEVVDTAASTSSSSSPPSTRLMAVGKCKTELKSGNIGLDCPCSRGIFSLSHTNDISDKCIDCEHSIADHEGIDIDIQRKEGDPRHTTLTKLTNLMDLYPLLYVRGIPDSGKGTVNQFRRENIMLMTREQEANSFFLPVDKPLEEFDSEDDRLLTQILGSFNRVYTTSLLLPTASNMQQPKKGGVNVTDR